MEIIHGPGRGCTSGHMTLTVERQQRRIRSVLGLMQRPSELDVRVKDAKGTSAHKPRNRLLMAVEASYLARTSLCTVEPKLNRPSVVANPSARCLEVLSSHPWTGRTALVLTRTLDTLCMIEGCSVDGRKTRFHLISESRKILTTMPLDCWN